VKGGARGEVAGDDLLGSLDRVHDAGDRRVAVELGL
jgi:hypothetical protein